MLQIVIALFVLAGLLWWLRDAGGQGPGCGT
jgi:hypothetical protein